MNLKLTKKIIKGVCSVSGPRVLFELSDAGQANVLINVALSDGTHIRFPDGSGTQTSQATVLPPGDFDCAVMVAAFSHGAFGSSFDTSVSIGGNLVATAVGIIPAGSDEDDDIQSFVLRVS